MVHMQHKILCVIQMYLFKNLIRQLCRLSWLNLGLSMLWNQIAEVAATGRNLCAKLTGVSNDDLGNKNLWRKEKKVANVQTSLFLQIVPLVLRTLWGSCFWTSPVPSTPPVTSLTDQYVRTCVSDVLACNTHRSYSVPSTRQTLTTTQTSVICRSARDQGGQGAHVWLPPKHPNAHHRACSDIEIADLFQYLGVHINNKLDGSSHTAAIYQNGQN